MSHDAVQQAVCASAQPRSAGARPFALATSVGLHAALMLVVATLSLAPLPAPEPVRVVIINAPEGGGGSAGPLRPLPPGEPHGPPAPPRQRIAAKPRPQEAAKPKPRVRQQPPVAAKAVAQPTLGTDIAAAAPAGGAAGDGSGGGGGGSGGGSGTGAGHGVGAGRGSGIDSVVVRYLRGVRKRLEDVKRYPMLARRRGTEGRTTIAIDISRDGRPAKVSVSSSSGSELLDIEAEEMVERAAPFAPLPAEITESTLRVVVPVSFDLGS